KASDDIRPGCISVFGYTEPEALVVIAELKTDMRHQNDGQQKMQQICQDIVDKVANDQQLECSKIVLIQPRTIPKTTSGKLQRNRARQMLDHHQLQTQYVYNNDSSNLLSATGVVDDHLLRYCTWKSRFSLVSKQQHQIQKWFFRYHSKSGDTTEIEPTVHSWCQPQFLWNLASIGYTELREACQIGDLKSVEKCLTRGDCVFRQDSSGQTPLHVAVLHNQLQCVTRLLSDQDAGLQLHVLNHRGQTPLHTAFCYYRFELCDLLIAKATTATLQLRDHNGWSIEDWDIFRRGDMFDACRLGDPSRIVQLHKLYDHSYKCELQYLGRTLLHEACENQHSHVLQHLLSQGISELLVLNRDMSGATALHVCARRGFLEGLVLLLDKTDTDIAINQLQAQDLKLRTALHWAILSRNHASSNFLIHCGALVGLGSIEYLDLKDLDGMTPLHYACDTGAFEIVQELIVSGANVNCPDYKISVETLPPTKKCAPTISRKPRNISISSEEMNQSTIEIKTLWFSLSSSKPQAPKCIKQDIAYPSIKQTSPLVIALRQSHLNIAEYLIDAGADITHGDVWKVYLSNSSVRSILNPLAQFWLDSAVFQSNDLVKICKDVCKWDNNELSAVALLELWGQIYGSLPINSELLALALRCKKLLLAACLHKLQVPWPGGSLSIVAKSKSFDFLEWILQQDYQPDVEDAEAMQTILKVYGHYGTIKYAADLNSQSKMALLLLQNNTYMNKHGHLISNWVQLAIRYNFTLVLIQLCNDHDQAIDATQLAHYGDWPSIQLCEKSVHIWSSSKGALAWTCYRNASIAIIRTFIMKKARVTPNFKIYGKPAVCWAAFHSRLDIIKVLTLLDGIAFIAELDDQGRSCLWYAARQSRVELFEYLYDTLVVQFKHEVEISPFIIAATESNQLGILQWIYTRLGSESFDHKNDNNDTLLHIACAWGYREVIRWLQATFSSFGDEINCDGYLPYELLMYFTPSSNKINPFIYKNISFVSIKRYYSMDNKNTSCYPLCGTTRSLLQLPMSTKRWTQLEKNWNKQNCSLYSAIGMKSIEHVQVLADHGLSLTKPRKFFDNLTPLQYAARGGATNIVTWLLQKGVQDNVVEPAYAIHLAAARASDNHGQIVQLLLNQLDAKVNGYLGRLSGDGTTATILHHVAKMQSPIALSIIDCLLDSFQADIDVVDSMGCTAALYALPTTLQNLIATGARLEAEYEGQSAFYYTLQLIPSDTWRCFFQVFLQHAMQSRFLHCVQEFCGCKSFDQSEIDEEYCQFCSHSIQSHNLIPLPSWYQDQMDTYFLPKPEPNDNSECGDMFENEEKSSDNAKDNTIALPHKVISGRLMDWHIKQIMLSQFQSVLIKYQIPLEFTIVNEEVYEEPAYNPPTRQKKKKKQNLKLSSSAAVENEEILILGTETIQNDVVLHRQQCYCRNRTFLYDSPRRLRAAILHWVEYHHFYKAQLQINSLVKAWNILKASNTEKVVIVTERPQMKTTCAVAASLDLSNLHDAATGAEPIRSDYLKQFADKFDIAGFRPKQFNCAYGGAEYTLLTCAYLGKRSAPRSLLVDKFILETTGVVKLLPRNDPRRQTGEGTQLFIACGVPMGDYDLRIVSPDSKQQVPDMNVGEIWVHGDSIAEGY
ncbi:hypothetical protein THRCLA_10260, partial [Thraustotheca clavata]